MKKITHKNYRTVLEKNRTLVKGSNDPTIVYVFSGHPHDSYVGGEDKNTILLYSLTTNEYTKLHSSYLDGEETKWYVVDSAEDIVGEEHETYQKFLNRVKKVFG